MKFNTTWPPDQLFELDITVVPFSRLAVIIVTEPPTGVTTAITMEFRLTVSGLGFVTLNCNTGTPMAPGNCVEFGGVPATVITDNTGGVEVGVGVAVGVFVGVFVGVLVGVLVGVFVGVFVGVLVGVFVGVLVGVFVGVDVGVKVGFATVITAPPTGTPLTCTACPDTPSVPCKLCKFVE